MKSCGEIREAVGRGAPLTDPETAAHLARCSACAEIARSPELFRAVLRGAPSPEAGGFAELERALQAESHGVLPWLWSRPTWLRQTLGGGAMLLLLAVVVLSGPRPDLDSYPRLRMMLEAGLLSAMLVVALAAAVRPVHRPLLARGLSYGLPLGLLAVLLTLAAMPGAAPAAPAMTGLLAGAFPCFRFGLLLGLPVYVLLRALDQQQSRLLALSAAAAAGVLGHLALHLHCGSTDRAHILAGHSTVAVAFVGAALLGTLLARRKRR